MGNDKSCLQDMSDGPVVWFKMSNFTDIVFPFSIFKTRGDEKSVACICLPNPKCCFFLFRAFFCRALPALLHSTENRQVVTWRWGFAGSKRFCSNSGWCTASGKYWGSRQKPLWRP